jgi:hypothetical protein
MIQHRDANSMRLESEVPRTVVNLTAVRARVRNALSFIPIILVAGILQLAPAYGQAMRTYVSGTGKDGTACTLANPCRTLQAALKLTNPGGEIQSLDSADYGYVTINQAVTLLGAHGATGVLAANVSGITINAGPNDVINLKGLDIDGEGSGGSGIQFNSGSTLNIQDSIIRGFASGINITSTSAKSFSVSDTVLSNNSIGLSAQSSATSTGVLSGVQVVNNASGIVAAGANSSSQVALTVQNSMVANNATVGILSNGSSTISVSNTTIANNGIGVEAQNGGALLQVSGSSLTGNTTGWAVLNGGQVISSTNNAIGGNINGSSPPPTSVAPPPAPAPSPAPSPPPAPPPAVSYVTDGTGSYFGDPSGGYIRAL